LSLFERKRYGLNDEEGFFMVLIPVLCPSCRQDKVVKRGKTEGGTQRFLCRNPNCATKSFLSEYTYNGSRKEVKEKIIEMTLCGSGIRDISRVLKISTDTVISGIKKKKTASLL
jgi:transposase-like protein